MHRHLFRLLLPLTATAVILLAGVRTHLCAQEAKPSPSTDTQPRLYLWKYPGMLLTTDYSKPKIVAITGLTRQNYADVFDYYAKKVGGSSYDLKQLTTFQMPGHFQYSEFSTAVNATGTYYVDAKTMQATFTRRTEHEYISIFLSRSRQNDETHISMTATTF